MQVGAEDSDIVCLLGIEQHPVSDVIEDKKNASLVVQAQPQTIADSSEMKVEVFTLFVAYSVMKYFVQGKHCLPKVGAPLAGYEESSAWIKAGERMSVGEGQFGLADASQAVNAGDRAFVFGKVAFVAGDDACSALVDTFA
jgi:hypothetical protein